MHLACAVGSRTVAIFQSSSFDHWGPPEDGVWVYEPGGASAGEVLKSLSCQNKVDDIVVGR